MAICSGGFGYGDDKSLWIPYNSTCLSLLTRQTISTTFNEVLIYLYRNESKEAFLKYSLNPSTGHETLIVDSNNPLRWQIQIPFSLYEGKIANGDSITAVLATNTNYTVEFGIDGKNTINTFDLGTVTCFPNDIILELN